MHEFCAKDKSTNAKAKIYAKLESNGTVGWSENLKTVLETWAALYSDTDPDNPDHPRVITKL